jgi:large subunit ribosomal protein L13
MIINAENQIVGRFASYAAKHALLGESIEIVNCEKAVMTGSRSFLLAKYKRKVDMGIPLKGPYFQRRPDMIVRRVIRGMIPYKQEKGMKAFKNIKCYIGVPANINIANTVKVPGADISKVPSLKYITVGEISKYIGAKL